jgi:FKBP-type peptidyl-prolyl cis-trans isomerase 2
MSNYKIGDFLNVDFDLWADEILINSTNQTLLNKAGIKHIKAEPQTIILGKNIILKQIDNEILKENNKETLELKPKEAYGEIKKELIENYTFKFFEEHKLKPIIGMVYNFDNKMGVIKSIEKEEIVVDFNHPLAGKNIKVNFSVKDKIEKQNLKIKFIINKILQIPNKVFEIKKNEINFIKDLKSIEKVILKVINENLKIENLKLSFDLIVKK